MARKVKRNDLSPTVGKQLVTSYRTGPRLVDLLRRFALAVDLGPFSCQARDAGDGISLVRHAECGYRPLYGIARKHLPLLNATPRP